MSKQRKKSKRISPRTMRMRVEFFNAQPGFGSDHKLELTLNGTHNGRIVKTKATMDLGNVQQLAGQLHNFVANEQRKVTLALKALQGPNPNGEQARP